MTLPGITNNIIDIVNEAGKFISRERENFDPAKTELKAKNDLVSYVDRETEKMLVEGLRKIYPAAGFITEEGTASERKEFNWIIDPLDGTTNFIHGIPFYCISVGLAKGSDIQCGVVLEVSRNECFYTSKGDDSFMNGKKIQVSIANKLSETLIATGFPVNNFDKMDAYKTAIDYFIRNTHGVRRIGAAAADLCYVACGRLDGFFEYNLKPWDVAAGALIVQNAGGKISDFSGKDNWLFGKEIVASTADIHHDFLKVVSGSFSA